MKVGRFDLRNLVKNAASLNLVSLTREDLY
jgi:hypothetical protein